MYSDFVGFREENPNGLLQVELGKKIPFSHNFGTYNNAARYIYPKLSWTKIEQQNRSLISELERSHLPSPTAKVNYIDLNRYSNLQLSLDLNVVSFQIPRLKSFLDFNLGGNILSTPLQLIDRVNLETDTGFVVLADTLDQTLVSSDFGFNVIWKLRMDPRWGMDFSFSMFQNEIFNSHDNSVIIQYDLNRSAWDRRFWVIGMFASYRPTDSNEFFFRARYFRSWQNRDFNVYPSFLQLQVGYSFNLINKVYKDKRNSK